MILDNLVASKKETQFVTERESPYTCKIFITTFFLFSDIKIYSFYDMSSETNGSIIGVIDVSSLDDHKPITFIFFRLKIVAIIFILFTQEHHCQQQASCNHLNRH